MTPLGLCLGPSSIRYLKSALRGLVSWATHCVMLCVPTNCDDEMVVSERGAEHIAEIDLC